MSWCSGRTRLIHAAAVAVAVAVTMAGVLSPAPTSRAAGITITMASVRITFALPFSVDDTAAVDAADGER